MAMCWSTVMVVAACVAGVAAAPHSVSHCDLSSDVAAARCVLHASVWGSLASTSTADGIEGYPFAGVKSLADGTMANSTGVPYFYLTPLDLVVQDLMKGDNRTTLVVSLAQTGSCAARRLDPMNPFCARIMLTGRLQEVARDTEEHEFAWKALLERHPEFQHYPTDHGFFVSKLITEHIFMINAHGPAKRVPVADFLAYDATTSTVSVPTLSGDQ